MFCHDSEPGTAMVTSPRIERKNTENRKSNVSAKNIQGLPSEAGLLICELKIYHCKALCSWAVLNIQVLFTVTYPFRAFYCIQCCMSCPAGHEIHFKSFFCIWMQFRVEMAFLIWRLFWFWIFKLVLTLMLGQGIGGNPCFSATEAQLESTYLVAVCEVSQSDAECTQHEGSSGNSCLQLETLLCWLTVCPAR